MFNTSMFKSLVIVLLSLLLSSLSAVRSQPDSTPANGKIAFVSNRDGSNHIYTMNPDGSNVVCITPDGDGDQQPRWSPDGKQIAFFSARNNLPGIYVMNADGTGVVNLSHSSDGDEFPSWSPDGRQITFTRFTRNGADIYIMNADGSEPTKVVDGANVSFNMMPVWSPDGRQILFNSTDAPLANQTSGYFQLKTIALAKGTQTTLAVLSGYGTPDWSWVTDTLIFDDLGVFYNVIQTMNSDGTNRITLTPQIEDQPARTDDSPSWSPDGQWIVFASSVFSNIYPFDFDRDIYVMDAAGNTITNLTPDNTANDIQPDWQPIPGAKGVE